MIWKLHFILATMVLTLANCSNIARVACAGQMEGGTGSIGGRVLDVGDQPVPGAIIVMCDDDSGVPVTREAFRPFTELAAQGKSTR